MGLIGQLSHPDVVSTINGAIDKIAAAGRNPGSLASDDNVEAYVNRGVKFMMTGWSPWVASGALAFQAKVANALS